MREQRDCQPNDFALGMRGQQDDWRGGMELDTLDPFDKDRMVDSTIELFLHSLRPTVSVLPSTRAAGKRRARHS